jgi:RNA polymerase sigma-70 factor, ECF subfamily
MVRRHPQFGEEPAQQYIELLGRHESRLLGLILSLVPNWADAEDIMQDVKVHLWKQFNEYDAAKDFGAWARTIAYYEVLAYRKKRLRHNQRFSTTCMEMIAEVAAAASDDLDDELQALNDCFEKLPESDRELLLLRYRSDDHTTRDIAARLGRTYEATRKAIFRSRLALADCIEEALHKRGER